MTLDEVIKHAEEVAEENQRVVDTGIVFDDVTVDMLYCDDTEVIEEHLANYQECADEYRQIAEWLKDYKRLREQTRWIPISERLPEDGGDYLVTIAFDIGGEELVREVKKDFFCILSKKWLNLSDDDVIAWMPLPKSYEPQESELENPFNDSRFGG